MADDFDEKIAERHREVLPLVEVAKGVLEKMLAQAIGGIGDPFLVRARLDPPRIKTPASIGRKARRDKRTADEALPQTPDLLGFRIVCNNLQDVRRCTELLETAVTKMRISVRRVDYVAKPTKVGYRAMHLEFRYLVKLNTAEFSVGCEIQIRSLLQDAWARLSRDDLYENGPRELVARMRNLATELAKADDLAEEIRRAIARPQEVERGALAPPSPGAMSFLFEGFAGRPAPDYLARMTSAMSGSMTRTDGLANMLEDPEVRSSLSELYQEKAGFAPGPEQTFRWIVLEATEGAEAARAALAEEAHSDAKEVENYYRSELRSEIPSKLDDLLDELKAQDKDDDPVSTIREWADGLGLLTECFCGEEYVSDIWDLADQLAAALEVEDEDERTEAADKIREALFAHGDIESCPVHGEDEFDSDENGDDETSNDE